MKRVAMGRKMKICSIFFSKFFLLVWGIFLQFFVCYLLILIKHSLIYRSSDSTMSEDAGIELRAVEMFGLVPRRSNLSVIYNLFTIFTSFWLEIWPVFPLSSGSAMRGRKANLWPISPVLCRPNKDDNLKHHYWNHTENENIKAILKRIKKSNWRGFCTHHWLNQMYLSEKFDWTHILIIWIWSSTLGGF